MLIKEEGCSVLQIINYEDPGSGGALKITLVGGGDLCKIVKYLSSLVE